MKYLIGLLAALALAYPSLAAEACQYYLDDVTTTYRLSGVPVTMLSEEQVAEAAGIVGLDGVTRGFIVSGRGITLLGLEKDGCLLPPIQLSSQTAPTVEPA